MNYELHDWQPFPEENIDPWENIFSPALCVSLPLMLMESLKRQICPCLYKWLQNRCCKNMLEKKKPSMTQHCKSKERPYQLGEVAHCETVIKYNMV